RYFSALFSRLPTTFCTWAICAPLGMLLKPGGGGAFTTTNSLGTTFSVELSCRLTAPIRLKVQSWIGFQRSEPSTESATVLEAKVAVFELARSYASSPCQVSQSLISARRAK